MVIPSHKPRVGARQARQQVCPKFKPVVSDYGFKFRTTPNTVLILHRPISIDPRVKDLSSFQDEHFRCTGCHWNHNTNHMRHQLVVAPGWTRGAGGHRHERSGRQRVVRGPLQHGALVVVGLVKEDGVGDRRSQGGYGRGIKRTNGLPAVEVHQAAFLVAVVGGQRLWKF